MRVAIAVYRDKQLVQREDIPIRNLIFVQGEVKK